MNKFLKNWFYDKRILIMYIITFIFLVTGITYALQTTSFAFNTDTAIINIDEAAYGTNTTLDTSNLDMKPIQDSSVTTSSDNVIKIDFGVKGASSNTLPVSGKYIYDVALTGLEVNCNLLSEYVKWKLIKNGEEISSGSLSPKYDHIEYVEDGDNPGGRLVLTDIQQDLKSNSEEADQYTFYMWVSDSCQGCDDPASAVDQTYLFGKKLKGNIEIETYNSLEEAKERTKDTSTSIDKDVCDNTSIDNDVVKNDLMVLFEYNKNDTEVLTWNDSLTTDERYRKSYIANKTYGTLPSATKKITITYNSNGGSSIDENTSDLTLAGWYKDNEVFNNRVDVNSTVINKLHYLYAKWNAYTIPLPNPTKAGYTFDGWYSDADLTNEVTSGDTTTESMTLYAKWISSIYNISLNNNNADSGGTSLIYAKYNDGIYLSNSNGNLSNKMSTSQNPITIPTKTGYTFGGYYGESYVSTNSTATSNYYFCDATDDLGRCKSNSGSSSSSSDTICYEIDGETVCEIQEEVVAPTLGDYAIKLGSGYTFDESTGEYTLISGSDSSPFDYFDEIIESIGSDEYKYFCSENNAMASTCSELKEASGVEVVDGKTYIVVSKIYSSESLQLINEDGYITSDFTNTKYTSNATLYAKWIPNEYTITYNLNYQNDNMNNWLFFNGYDSRFTINYNNSTNLNNIRLTSDGGWEIVYLSIDTVVGNTYKINFDYNIPNDYTPLSGYAGVGYQVLTAIENNDNTNNSIVTKYLPTSATTSTETAVIEFTATTIKTYFAFNFGMAADNVTTEIDIGNIKITQSEIKLYDSNFDTLPIVTRLGYTFEGWYTAPTGGTQIDSTTPVPSSDTTYYAHWSANKVHIRYNTNGGSWVGSSVTDFSVDGSGNVLSNGSVYELIINFGNNTDSNGLADYDNANYINISRTGYTAAANAEWKCLSGCTDKTFDQNLVYSASDFCDASNGDCTVVLGVNWAPNNYTITYDTNGANNYISAASSVILTDFTGATNHCFNIGRMFLNTLAVNDTIKISFDITYSGVTADTSQSTYGIYPQGGGNNNAWSYGMSFKKLTTQIIGSGTYHYEATRNISAGNLENTYYYMNIRTDYITAGTIKITNLKITKITTTTVAKTYGTTLGTLPTVTDMAYTFAGWYTSATGGTQISSSTSVPSANTTYYAHWTPTSYTLTVNPNGGTYNNATTNTTYTGTYHSLKNIGSPVVPSGYTVTYNYNSATGGNSNASTTSTKSFSGWTLTNTGEYVAASVPSVGGMTRTSKTSGVETYDNFTYSVNNPTANTWYSFVYPAYTYTSGHVFEISWTSRANSFSGSAMNFRHSAVNNDYGTPGLVTTPLVNSTSWYDYTFARTITGTTTTLNGNSVTIAPRFEGVTSNLINTTSSANFDIKDMVVINKTTDTLLQSNANMFRFGLGNGTLTANYTNNSITLPSPTRTGYTFGGWYTNSSLTGTSYAAGASYTPTANITLYAKWTRNFTCNGTSSSHGTSTYMKQSWESYSDGTYCYLYANFTVGSTSGNKYDSSSGTSGTVYSYIKTLSNGTNTIDQEKSLISDVNSATGKTGSLNYVNTSGTASTTKYAYWTSSGSVYDPNSYTTYSLSSYITVTGGYVMLDDEGDSQTLRKFYNGYTTSTRAAQAVTGVSTSATTYSFANGTMPVKSTFTGGTTSDTNYHFSKFWTLFAPDKISNGTSSEVALRVWSGGYNTTTYKSVVNLAGKSIGVYICGGPSCKGENNNSKAVEWSPKDTSYYYYKSAGTTSGPGTSYLYPSDANRPTLGTLTSSGTGGYTTKYIYPRTWAFAGKVASYSSSTLLFNLYANTTDTSSIQGSYCTSFDSYAAPTSKSVPILYRPYLKVKYSA